MSLREVQEHLKNHGQILKTRDDQTPVFLDRCDGTEETATRFTLTKDVPCSWAKGCVKLGSEELRPRIEPWLTALVQSEHLSLLVGSGLTHAAHAIATRDSFPDMNSMMVDVLDKSLNDAIEAEAKRVAEMAGRTIGNFEDQVRIATELLRGMEILTHTSTTDAILDKRNKRIAGVRQGLNNTLSSFAQSILEGEKQLILASSKRHEKAFNHIVNFLLSFASRSGTRERLHLFTTNYDRYLEAGADIAGLRLIDRFVGTLTPIFRASRLNIDLHYNPPGIRYEPRYIEGVARFTKLHGSVDWVDCGDTIRRIGLPFGAEDIAPYLAAPGLIEADEMRMMIYPNAAKDRETAAYPYVELFRDFAAATCRPNSSVVCYGYGFGDDHINRVLEDMLTIPSTHLVIIAYGDPLGRIMSTYEKLGRHTQVTLLIGNYFGDLETLVHYLPKPAIDRTTFRMAELLKARWSVTQQEDDEALPFLEDEEGGTDK